jgi:hypothetical protein
MEGQFDTSKYLQDTMHDCNMLTMIDSIRFLLHSTVPINHLLSPESPNFKALTPNTSTRYGSDQPPAWPFAIELQSRLHLALQHGRSRDLVRRTVARWLTLSIVDADQDAGVRGRVSTGETDSASGAGSTRAHVDLSTALSSNLSVSTPFFPSR